MTFDVPSVRRRPFGAYLMSMPQPIHVVLLGSTVDIVRKAKKYFRLSAPGIGPPYLATLDGECSDPIRRLDDVPTGLIHLWVTLDKSAFLASQDRYRLDTQHPHYDRGFYGELLPNPCVLVDFERSPTTAKKELSKLADEIISAWYDTS